MARYDTYGKQDDRIAEEFDTGFIGFNNRLRPDQLKPGVLTVSENGRLDLNGEWQTRKAIEHLASPFQASVLFSDNSTDSKLKLFDNASVTPTGRTDNPTSGASVNSSTGVMTITFSGGGHGISADYNGHVFFLNGFVGNVKIDGNYLITRISATQISVVVSGLTTISTRGEVFGLSLDDSAANVIEFAIEYSDPNNNSESYVLCIGTNSAAAVKCSDGSVTSVSYPVNQSAVGATATQAFGKVFIFRDGKVAMEWDGTLTGTPSFSLVPNGSFTNPADIIVPAGSFQVLNQIATVVSDTGSLNKNASISIKNGVNPDIEDTSDSGYDISSSGLRQGFEFFIKEVFADGSEKDISTTSLSTTAGTGSFAGYNKATFTTAVAHDLKVSDPIFISNYHSSVDGNRIVAEVGSTTTFSIYVSGTLSSQAPVPGGGVIPKVKIKKGFTFSVPAVQNAEGLQASDGSKTSKDTLAATPTFLEKASEGGSFIHMPAPAFGEYHQARLAVPFRYDMDEDSTGTTITDRNIHDEIILSRALFDNEYDKDRASFRLNAGTSDFVVGLHSFSDDKLVVFNRSSIHIISDSINVEKSKNTLITNEVGCIARRSIIQVANNLIFLSDNGVYGVDFQDLYNLRGRDLPISATIESTIKDLNKDYADKAVGVYFNNRYYLAAPFGSSVVNNKVIIYNFINKNWESIDSVSAADWAFSNLVVAGKGNKRGVYAVNSDGGVHRLEASDSAVDQYIPSVGQPTTTAPIAGVATTRMYTNGSIDRKKWNNFEIHAQSSSQSSDGNLFAITENIDSTAVDPSTGNLVDSSISLGSLSSLAGKTGGNILDPNEDYSIRGRIGNPRAYGLQLSLETTTGRPKLRSIKVAGAKTFRNLQPAE